MISGTATETNSGHFVYVALDDERHTTTVRPPLIETVEERQAFKQAEARREARLKARG